MINYLALTIIGGILVGGIIWDGYYGFVLFPYLSESPCEISVNSCDNMNKLLYHFNTFRGSLDRDTRIYMPTSLETEINWFDKACHVGWNYLKGTCSITLTDNSKQFVNYWLYGTATEMNWFDLINLVILVEVILNIPVLLLLMIIIHIMVQLKS